ncbi:hypothetical protein GC105_00705 [Alkalibaculum sp. M08DMB]|uniref:Sigma factor regulator C-terminal domain-containing protein n=1 Tax=Alkalibaculum sporogenes TaxID=2655001 RepID=A0A6A7K596_9FIRM|nr:anti sigma factor C-terminal domain-containing protein [Alkalibaculum sporogenes]MPW24313.1 hypothetical protein [Alkalibaculum sporogenes]
MSFKELLNAYIAKKIPESQKKYVEEEIEKFQVISDYLEDQQLKIKPEDMINKESLDELYAIKKSMKRRTRRTVFMSACLVISILIFINFTAIPLMDHLFYNPFKRTMSSQGSDFELCMEVYHELHFAEPNGIGITTDRTGIGEYDITIMGYNYMQNEYQYQIAKLKRGEFSFPINYWDNFLGFYSDGGIDFELQKNYLSQLPSYVTIQAKVSFNQDLSMEDLAALSSKYKDSGIWFSWAGIRIAEDRNDWPPMAMGFDMVGDGNVYSDVNEKYPNYEVDEYITNQNNQTSSELYETHVKSLLKIMIDNKKFLKLQESGFDLHNYYKSSLDFLEQNGVNTIGIIVNGDPKSVLGLCEEEFIGNVQINSVQFK